MPRSSSKPQGKLYEHALGAHGKHFTAFNMTYGPFGGSVRDLLAVQSMDGQLAVYEQDAHAFTRDIPGLLVPGPLLYVLRIDSFVLANSELGLDCYRSVLIQYFCPLLSHPCLKSHLQSAVTCFQI
jgi:hypothetical protein